MSQRTRTALIVLALAIGATTTTGCAGSAPSSNAELEKRIDHLESELARTKAAPPTTTPGSAAPTVTATSTTTTAPVAHVDPPINRVKNGPDDTAALSLQQATSVFPEWYSEGAPLIDRLAAAVEAVDTATAGTSRSALIDACYELRDAADAAGAAAPLPDMVATRYWTDGTAALSSATDWCTGTADGDPTAAANLRSEIESGLTSLRAVAQVLS